MCRSCTRAGSHWLKRPREAIGLLLVVALEADPVAGAQDRLQQVDDGRGRHDLAGGMRPARLDPRIARCPFPTPAAHPIRSLLGRPRMRGVPR